MKIEGSGSASRSGFGSISQRHESADPDPHPHQNIMDPKHWHQYQLLRICISFVQIRIRLLMPRRMTGGNSNIPEQTIESIPSQQCSGSGCFWAAWIRISIYFLYGSVYGSFHQQAKKATENP